MALTDPNPLPPALAFPAGEEPITESDLEAFVADVLQLAEDAALDPEAVVGQIAEAREAGQVENLRPAERWRIEDDGAAEWALRHLVRIEAEEQEIAAQAAAWVAEIQRWAQERSKPLAARRAFFEGAALDYLRRLREEDPKIKSRKLPSGTIKSSASGAKVGIADEDAVVAWAREHLEGDELAAVVKVTTKPMVSELRKVATVARQQIAVAFEGGLSCGHPFGHQVPTDPDGAISAGLEIPTVGDGWPCLACPEEFGEPPVSTVVELASEEIFEEIVADNDTGERVPGAVVEPAHVRLGPIVLEG